MNSRNRSVYLMILLGLACALLSQFVLFTPSQQDIESAKRTVSTRTAEKIFDVQIRDNGFLEIRTEWLTGPLEGGGHNYFLHRIFGFWWIYKTESWEI